MKTIKESDCQNAGTPIISTIIGAPRITSESPMVLKRTGGVIWETLTTPTFMFQNNMFEEQ